MKYKISTLATLSIVSFIFFIHQVSAHSDTEDYHEQLETVLVEVVLNHDAESIDNLSCDEITNEEFERIGDALMER